MEQDFEGSVFSEQQAEEPESGDDEMDDVSEQLDNELWDENNDIDEGS